VSIDAERLDVGDHVERPRGLLEQHFAIGSDLIAGPNRLKPLG
jgi:hypothetical protein